jgi:hypothetical protein
MNDRLSLPANVGQLSTEFENDQGGWGDTEIVNEGHVQSYLLWEVAAARSAVPRIAFAK